jgi:GAF domain-containing protein
MRPADESNLMSPIDSAAAQQLTTALAAGPTALIAQLSAWFLELPGARTMTYLATSPDKTMTHRIGTSDPQNFPIGGFDILDDGAWTRRVFGEKQPVVANTLEEMVHFIPEAEGLVEIGHGATMCAPVIIAGEVRGVVCVLGPAGIFTPDFLARFNALLPLAGLIFAFEGISIKR